MLNTIVAEAIDDLADKLEAQVEGGTDLDEALTAVVKDAYGDHKRVIFAGDNYSDEWHAEAESRGLKNLRTTPDALPEVLAEPTVAAFEKYEVLSQRELESRYEVWLEQYVIRGEHRGGDRRDRSPRRCCCRRRCATWRWSRRPGWTSWPPRRAR